MEPSLQNPVEIPDPFQAPSDETFASTIASYIRRNASAGPAHIYIETAGGKLYFHLFIIPASSRPGVHSPTLSGTTQAEAYRPLFLPTILIGDSKLGGISTTIAAYEALLLRGYIIDAVLLFRENYYQNADYLKNFFAEKGVYVSAVDPPPPLLSDHAENVVSTQKYYEHIVPLQGGKHAIHDVVKHLDICHSRRLDELSSMPRRTLDTIWWPFVQHGLVKREEDVNVIDSATSDFFSVYNQNAPPSTTASVLTPQFDSSASWWTQTFGHAYTPLTLAAARAAGRYGHVMFPQATHLPALKLAERLVKDGPGKGWASRAFFSDNGSTGMEVALKMALRAFSVRCGSRKGEVLGVLGLKGSYHGDTIGAMDACEESGVYTCEWHDAKGFWFEPPTVGMQDGEVIISVPGSFGLETRVRGESFRWVYDVESRLDSELAKGYRAYITRTLRSLERRRREGEGDLPRLAALVLEPLVMGAGGMIFVDPLFQRVLIEVVRSGDAELGLAPKGSEAQEWSGLPLVFDEVFAGLYRLGMESTNGVIGAFPDIAVNAKTLTGGLVPLAVTLASESVFNAFLAEGKEKALLHGHSYTAHAVGCEVAVETLSMIGRLKDGEGWKAAQESWGGGGFWSFWDPGFVQNVSGMEVVQEVMALGCVLAVRLKDQGGGASCSSVGMVNY